MRYKRYKDPLLHEMRRAYIRARAQAEYRNQNWDLEFEDYCLLWNNLWINRGRNGKQLQMCRIDQSKGWFKNNIIIQSRTQHLSNLMMEKNNARTL